MVITSEDPPNDAVPRVIPKHGRPRRLAQARAQPGVTAQAVHRFSQSALRDSTARLSSFSVD